VANQIAAGEVVQRPSSVVKELVENAVDAGATQVKLFVRDAGKTLIQVTDNGCGMSETDARMSFERHATSKIRDAKDLFCIRTMGFRGEALASIAAVAQVELRTRRAKEEVGTRIFIEDSIVKVQEPFQCPPGTTLAVKNLFYNVPARRNFLKSDSVEMRHILEEFQRIALANPDLFFSLHHNDQEIFHLVAGNLRQRVTKIFGDVINKHLVPVQQETDVLKINGFVSKPEYYKKNRGEQVFFVNKRFVKSPYLHAAVVAAYEQLMPNEAFPLYVLDLHIDPSHIDINVHPTKQEIKFDDEKLVFHFLKVAVKHALGTHNVTPAIDFDTEPAFQQRPVEVSSWTRAQPESRPKADSSLVPTTRPDAERHASNTRHWETVFRHLGTPVADPAAPAETIPEKTAPADPNVPFVIEAELPAAEVLAMDDEARSFSKNQKEPYQIHRQYIVSHIKSGFVLIDQQAASERILYERYLETLDKGGLGVQKILFPKQLQLSTADAALLRSILPDMLQLGFEIDSFGGDSFVIHGAPAHVSSVGTEEELILRLLDQYKNNLDLNTGVHDNLCRSLAKSTALRRGQPLSVAEMQELIDQLFACSMPFNSPSGRLCFIQYELEELHKRFASN
jgi:DNA mismatch repair protein MutL